MHIYRINAQVFRNKLHDQQDFLKITSNRIRKNLQANLRYAQEHKIILHWLNICQNIRAPEAFA